MAHDLVPSRHSHVGPPSSDAVGGRLLIVSNRLPITLVDNGDGISVGRSSGGLATGLAHIQRRSGATWIGWTGLADAPCASRRDDIDDIDGQLRAARMMPVHLTRRDVARFYDRVCNGVLWPLLHDLEPAAYNATDWETYRTANARFADAIVREIKPGDCVWVHDYHLMLVPRLVRDRCPWARIAFFLHTPFPDPQSFVRFRHAASLLDGLLGADAIGLHTEEYVQRFIAAVDDTRRYRTRQHVIHDRRRPVVAFASPMSIDATEFGTIAAKPTIAVDAMRLRGTGPLFVGVDRLDYTKGIAGRLRAFERLLERDSALVGRARFVQIAVPSRESVSAYRRARAEVEANVRRINERWATAEWSPIDYRYTSIDQTSLVTLYRAADVMLVTPVRDGLNLVAKEFVASRVDNDGVLVLSDRAGAAAELRTALLVDPTDEGALTDTYVAALNMLPAERRVRMRHMRFRVAAHDVYRWADAVLGMVRADSPAAGHVGGA
jgi:trehalose 6-phosphate synthase/phosphatase